MMNIIRKIKKLFFLLPVSLYRKALFFGVAAAIEHEKLLKNKSYKTIVDIGANRGQFSLVARNTFKKAKIYAFDPLKTSKRIFNKIFYNHKNINFFNVAIGPSKEKRTIHISKKEDSSSILSIGKLQSDLFPGTEESHEATIKVDRLDSFINKSHIQSPALLKLDVQGFELQALRGCENFFEDIDYIYCECSFMSLYKNQSLVTDVVEFLISKDFKISGVFNMQSDSDGKNIQADFFFVKKYH